MRSKSPSRRPRRHFSDEYKAGAVRLVIDEGKTVGAVARDLDLTETALRNWVERARADRSGGKTGLTTAEREELTRLRKEVRVLAEEREILKNHRARRVPRSLLDQKLPGRLLSRYPGRSGRLLFGDASNP
jgi:transposase